MIHVTIAMHGMLAQSLIESIEMLVGDQQGVSAFTLCPEDDAAVFRAEIATDIVAARDRDEEIIALTDILAGTPFNSVCAVEGCAEFIHVTGVNLPVALGIVANREGRRARELVDEALEDAPSSLLDVTGFGQRARSSPREGSDDDE
ncbi:PTS sugar transporter subunit IIA [Enorma sp.]|uniref:PTS sugar transporter subunit IIA n=1 Tax=Enorma sp. TaxID=1920692 RepID=UPI003AB3A6A9